MPSELDRLAGGEPSDVAKKHQVGTPKDRAHEMSQDDLVPEKAMPMKQTPVPFKISGSGNGG